MISYMIFPLFSAIILIKRVLVHFNYKIIYQNDILRLCNNNNNTMCFFSFADPLFVVMEYAKLGKLQSVLRNSRGINYYTNTHGPSSLTSHELIMFCYQIAKGMDFLSSKGVWYTEHI